LALLDLVVLEAEVLDLGRNFIEINNFQLDYVLQEYNEQTHHSLSVNFVLLGALLGLGTVVFVFV